MTTDEATQSISDTMGPQVADARKRAKAMVNDFAPSVLTSANLGYVKETASGYENAEVTIKGFEDKEGAFYYKRGNAWYSFKKRRRHGYRMLVKSLTKQLALEEAAKATDLQMRG